MQTLIDLAAPLAPADRSKFVGDVAAELARYPDVGDGLVTRIARKVQRVYVGYVHGSGKRTKYI